MPQILNFMILLTLEYTAWDFCLATCSGTLSRSMCTLIYCSSLPQNSGTGSACLLLPLVVQQIHAISPLKKYYGIDSINPHKMQPHRFCPNISFLLSQMHGEFCMAIVLLVPQCPVCLATLHIFYDF